MYVFCFHNCSLCPHPKVRATFSWGKCSCLSVHWDMTLARFQDTLVLFPTCAWPHGCVFLLPPLHFHTSDGWDALGSATAPEPTECSRAQSDPALLFTPSTALPALWAWACTWTGPIDVTESSRSPQILWEHSVACVGHLTIPQWKLLSPQA